MPAQNEIFWRKLREVQKGITAKCFAYFFEVFDPEEMEEAWAEFNNFDIKEKFTPEHPLSALFITWFFQSWEPNEDEPPIIMDMLTDLVDELSELEVLYISLCVKTQLRYFEITEVVPDSTIKVRDLLTLVEHIVMERNGSRFVKQGDFVFAKLINIQDINVFESLAPIVIQPKFKFDIIKHLQSLNKNEKNELQHIDLFLNIYDRLMNPVKPTFTNTDGHLLIPHKLIFDIESPTKIFDLIHSLCFEETKNELLKSAIFDEAKNIIKIEFSWLAKGNKTNKQWTNTVLGRIDIEGKRMIVEVNSKERADHFLKILKDLKAEGWKLKSTLIESIEQQLKTAPASQNTMTDDPEILDLMERNIQAHWENWIDMKLPALGNKKPKDAIKTKKGKALVDALICDFERSAIDRPIHGQTSETFKKLRIRLGLL